MNRPHPHFDDRGTLDWHTSYAEALRTARRDKKLVFVEFGREPCGNCRALVQGVVPHPEVAPLLREHFVALASDCDDPEEAVGELTLSMPDAMMLPFAIFADAEGRFLGGTEGAQSASGFKAILEQTIAAANASR
ncbi:MAG TPA: thioredoxin family protein [Planctomycetota bacterium]|nr:thioredoxin family protein [Planctomycetota bacterium]